MVDTWEVVDTVQVRNSAELHEVLPSLIIHSDKNQMIARLIFDGIFVGMFARSYICLDTNEWLDAIIGALFIKLNGTRECSMVCHSDSFHARSFGKFNKLRDLCQTVE